jgi:hypothetical protein
MTPSNGVITAIQSAWDYLMLRFTGVMKLSHSARSGVDLFA